MLTGCGEKIKPGEKSVERPLVTGVATEQTALTAEMVYYEASGTVTAKNTSLVSAKVMGEVREIRAAVSDRVRKGDVLLEIHSPDIEARAAAAREAVGEAGQGLMVAEENRKHREQTYERFKRLYEEKAISEQEFDGIRTQREVAVHQYELAQKTLEKAEAARREAEAFKGYTFITSPVNGIVAERKIDRGSTTVPGSPLFIIEEPVYRVEVPVDEGRLSSVRIGDQVIVLIDTLDMTTTGRAGEIVSRIDPLTRTFTVKIDLKEDGAFRDGLYARVKFPAGRKSTLYVNEDSLVSRGELRGVYVVDPEGVIALRLVKTGKHRDKRVEILSGLSEGERIIVSGTAHAVDGGKIDRN